MTRFEKAVEYMAQQDATVQLIYAASTMVCIIMSVWAVFEAWAYLKNRKEGDE